MSSDIKSITYDDAIPIVVGQVYTKAFAGLYIGTAGAVTLVTAVGTSVTLATTIAGTIIPIAFQSVTSGPANMLGLRAIPFRGSS
jgi:hypothetical protein